MALIRQLLAAGKPGETVAARGWVRTRRDAKGFSFIEINDGSCLSNIQVVADSTMERYAETAEKLTTGSSLTVWGTLAASPGSGQAVELHAQVIDIHNIAPADYVLQKKRHSFEYLRGIAHLRQRTNAIGAVMRMRSSLSFAVHRFFQERGFFYVHTPIITTSDCEGAGEMFRVTTLDPANPPRTEYGDIDYSKDFFGRPASLTVSGQLEGECCALAMGRIYTFGPTFRAENSHTTRHLAEFWMIEPEAAFFTLAEDMDIAEEFVRFLARHTLESCGEDLAFFAQRVEPAVAETLCTIADNGFERLRYTDAVSILEKENDRFTFKVAYGTDIQSEHERFLTETHFKKPVIVYDYPREIKAFYMKLNEDKTTVKAMDLLVPRIGELIGGSEREDSLDILDERITQAGMNVDDYWWYRDLRKYGSVPHAGFGLGFERLMLLVTGMQNIRDVIPFPRYPGSAEF